jgi:hypothetical protein
MAVRMTMLFWVVAPCRLVGRDQCFRETSSIFRAEVAVHSLKTETVYFSETLVSTYESSWRYSLEEHHLLTAFLIPPSGSSSAFCRCVWFWWGSK